MDKLFTGHATQPVNVDTTIEDRHDKAVAYATIVKMTTSATVAVLILSLAIVWWMHTGSTAGALGAAVCVFASGALRILWFESHHQLLAMTLFIIGTGALAHSRTASRRRRWTVAGTLLLGAAMMVYARTAHVLLLVCLIAIADTLLRRYLSARDVRAWLGSIAAGCILATFASVLMGAWGASWTDDVIELQKSAVLWLQQSTHAEAVSAACLIILWARSDSMSLPAGDGGTGRILGISSLVLLWGNVLPGASANGLGELSLWGVLPMAGLAAVNVHGVCYAAKTRAHVVRLVPATALIGLTVFVLLNARRPIESIRPEFRQARLALTQALPTLVEPVSASNVIVAPNGFHSQIAALSGRHAAVAPEDQSWRVSNLKTAFVVFRLAPEDVRKLPHGTPIANTWARLPIQTFAWWASDLDPLVQTRLQRHNPGLKGLWMTPEEHVGR